MNIENGIIKLSRNETREWEHYDAARREHARISLRDAIQTMALEIGHDTEVHSCDGGVLYVQGV